MQDKKKMMIAKTSNQLGFAAGEEILMPSGADALLISAISANFITSTYYSTSVY
jgi:hypothetical protein